MKNRQFHIIYKAYTFEEPLYSSNIFVIGKSETEENCFHIAVFVSSVFIHSQAVIMSLTICETLVKIEILDFRTLSKLTVTRNN